MVNVSVLLLKNGQRNSRNCLNYKKSFESKIREYAEPRIGEGMLYSFSFHHCSGSTDSATVFSISYRCPSSEVYLTPSSVSESISLKRFSLGSYIVLLTQSVSSCAFVFNQSSLATCCLINDHVCSFASRDMHFKCLCRGSSAVAIFNIAMLHISYTFANVINRGCVESGYVTRMVVIYSHVHCQSIKVVIHSYMPHIYHHQAVLYPVRMSKT